MSASKTRMANRIDELQQRNQLLGGQLTRLLNYVVNMQEDHPDLAWPDLPDEYPEVVWRYVML